MVVLRPVLRLSPELTFAGGIIGAVLFLFILIAYASYREQHGKTGKLNWFRIGLSEFLAMAVSCVVHPVCITTCVLFSIPVIIYIKWAATKMSLEK